MVETHVQDQTALATDFSASTVGVKHPISPRGDFLK
jgi:hypothetical protein